MADLILTELERTWYWPDRDTKCRKAVFQTSDDLREVYRHCSRFRTAIQAGGNMGVWPWRMARKFKRVITAEPDPVCFPYLDKNVTNSNVQKLHAAFSDRPSGVDIVCDPVDVDNLGAQYVRFGGHIPAITIDSLGVDDCDLIYLDVEGAELLALRGAVGTIQRCSPVIAVEDKKLSARFGSQKGDIEKWLGVEFGYRVVSRPHRDVVLVR